MLLLATARARRDRFGSQPCLPHITDSIIFVMFGWNVIAADAHDFQSIENAVNAAKACKGKPSVIIAKSVKGKGVSYMENQASWHGAAPNAEQYEIAMRDLGAAE